MINTIILTGKKGGLTVPSACRGYVPWETCSWQLLSDPRSVRVEAEENRSPVRSHAR